MLMPLNSLAFQFHSEGSTLLTLLLARCRNTNCSGVSPTHTHACMDTYEEVHGH